MGRKKKQICVSCEQRPVEPESEDPDFCLHCQRRIDHMIEHPMYHARAAGCLADGLYSNRSPKRDQFVLFAFLSIFHPRMPTKRRLEITFDAHTI